MERLDNFNEDKSYILAKKRVEELKGYYRHLIIYIVINLVICYFKIYDNMQSGDTFYEALTSYSTFLTPFLWGIGLAIHTFKTFGLNLVLGASWQQKKIDEYMNRNI